MISVEEMLKIDPSLSDLSEADLIELRDNLYEVAQLGFEVYYSKKNVSKCPVGLFPSPQSGSSI